MEDGGESKIGYWDFNEGSGTTLSNINSNNIDGTIMLIWSTTALRSICRNYNSNATVDDEITDNGDYVLSFDL